MPVCPFYGFNSRTYEEKNTSLILNLYNMNYNINSSGIYDVNSYNLISKNATILSSLNVAGDLIGSGTALFNLNYSSIINPPDLTVYNSWSKSGNYIYNTNLLSGQVGIGLSNPVGRLEILMM